MENGYPTYEQWFAALPPAQKARANEMVAKFRALGACDPERWARSELSENIAQLSRFLALRRVWSDHIDSWRTTPNAWIDRLIMEADRDALGPFADAGTALRQMFKKGVHTGDIASFARMVAYETAFGVLSQIDEGHDPDAPPDAPGWILVETTAEGEPTGRDVAGLHESLLTMDPSGREGRPE